MRIVETGRNLRSIVTRRSLLPPPGAREDPRWERSWEHLVRAYRPAMVRYVEGLLRRGGEGSRAEEAEEVVQDYLARSMERGWLAPDGEEIRCFRAYLQVQLRRYAGKHLRAKGAREERVRSLEEGGDAAPAEAAELDRSWVEVALERALAILRRGNAAYAAVIEDQLATAGAGSPDLGARLGRSQEQMVHLRHRARRRFSILFHEQLRATVRDEEAFEELCARLAPLTP